MSDLKHEEQLKQEALRMISRGLITDLKLKKPKGLGKQVGLFEAALREYEEAREKAGWKNGNSIHVGHSKREMI